MRNNASEINKMLKMTALINLFNCLLLFSKLLLTLGLCLLCLKWLFGHHLCRVYRWYSMLRQLPGPPPLPFVNITLMRGGFFKSLFFDQSLTFMLLQAMRGFCQVFESEGLYKIWLATQPNVILFKPESIEKVLTSTAGLNKSENYNFLIAWLGTGLLTSSSEKWRSRRKLLTPTFHFKILDDFVPIFNEQADVLVSKLKQTNGEVVNDIVCFINKCTLDIICETAMGVKIGAQNDCNSKYAEAVDIVSESFAYRNIRIITWCDWIFHRTNYGKKYLKSLDYLHQFTMNVIKIRKQTKIKQLEMIRKNKKKSEDIGRKKRLAFLDLLLEHHLSENPSLTEEDIREEVDTFMFAGNDSTSTTISWALYLLGLHPEIQEKLHQELDEVFGDERSRPITSDDMKQMKYLECCIKETLRLYPAAPMIGRYYPDDIELEGYKIPGGVSFFIFIFQLHRNKEIYPNPERFIPERFAEDSPRHPFAYIPFSAGQRNCIGQKFGFIETKVVLANVLRNFKIESMNEIDKITIAFELVCRPKTPLSMRFVPR